MLNVEKSTPSPIQVSKCCHTWALVQLFASQSLKPLSNCLICLFNQHANKSIYFSKAITSRNDTTIKPKMHTKKPETDRLIVHSPQRTWSLSPEKLAIMKTTTSIVCFCLVLCALVCTCEKALEAPKMAWSLVHSPVDPWSFLHILQVLCRNLP